MKRNTLIMLLVFELLVGLILSVIVATTFFARGELAPIVSQDKSVCAATGIGFQNYAMRYETASEMADSEMNVSISYAGKIMTCQTDSPIPSPSASCKIQTKTDGDMWILVATDGKTCWLSDVKGEVHPKEESYIGLVYLIIICALDVVAILVTTALIIKNDEGKVKAKK